MKSTHSTKRTLHVVRRTRDGSLELRPGTNARTTSIIFLALTPVVFYIGLHYKWPTGLRIGVIMFPLLGACAYGVIHYFTSKFGVRALFNAKHRQVLLTTRELFGPKAEESLPLESIRAVQLVFAREVVTSFQEKRQDGPGYREKGDSWDSYQLNLDLQDQAKRQLLESGDRKKLELIGKTLSKFLRVPLEVSEKE